ncbi:hypothetical protein MHU86_20642 [Fragilaria crotonensis]|nr:hypothetical protein MHU86_20642 [Fragilaria crotonensis]
MSISHEQQQQQHQEEDQQRRQRLLRSSSMTSVSSDSILSPPESPPLSLLLKPTMAQATTSALRLRMSPSSIITAHDSNSSSEFYAPSRKKRVTFATEVVLKPPPVEQRLRGLSLTDLDHGVSVCRAAFLPESGESYKSMRKRTTKSSTTTKKSSSSKPIEVLERRLIKITRELVEASFELEVGQNDVDELIRENEELEMQLTRKEMTQMGYDKLEDSVADVERKIRKYTSKTTRLRRATEFYNAESALMIDQLKVSKSLLRRNAKNDKLPLESIPEVHKTAPSAA